MPTSQRLRRTSFSKIRNLVPLTALLATGMLTLPFAASADTGQEPPEPVESQGATKAWYELIGPGSLDAWQRVDERLVVGGDAQLAPNNPKQLEALSGKGVLVAEKKAGIRDLITKRGFGDCELHAEFLISQGSNSGIKFHGHYEIQVYDSCGKPEEKLTGSDCGGVYPRWHWVDRRFTYLDDGIAPIANAAKPPGQWQTLDAVFRAPRFDDEGNKTENARLISVKLNGTLIHEDVELRTPTGLARDNAQEYRSGPLLIQVNHGPVAYRNVRVRELPAA